MPKINRVDIYAREIKKYNGGSGVSENNLTGKKLEILQLTEICQYEKKENFSMNWKISLNVRILMLKNLGIWIIEKSS